MYAATQRLLNEALPDVHLLAACVWKIGIPFLLLTAGPTLYRLLPLGGSPPAAPANDELLVFSAFMFIEGGLELRRARLGHSNLLLGLAVLALTLFVSARSLAVDDAGLARALSYFNYTVALCSVVITLYAFSAIARAAARRRLEDIARPARAASGTFS